MSQQLVVNTTLKRAIRHAWPQPAAHSGRCQDCALWRAVALIRIRDGVIPKNTGIVSGEKLANAFGADDHYLARDGRVRRNGPASLYWSPVA